MHGHAEKAHEANWRPYLLVFVSATTQFLEGDEMPDLPNNMNNPWLVSQTWDNSTSQQTKTSTESSSSKKLQGVSFFLIDLYFSTGLCVLSLYALKFVD